MTIPHIWGARQVGAPAHPDTWSFAIWSPDASDMAVSLDGVETPMAQDSDGVWRAHLKANEGEAYGFVTGGTYYPDPAARRQSGNVHSMSRLTTTQPYSNAHDWRGLTWSDAVILEVHIGTFTKDGTLISAIKRIDGLAELGITAIELMPLAQFGGARGWGYDGVLPYAIHPSYGTRGDLRSFINACHAADIAVILDVVYNHFGPDGSYMQALAPAFFDPSRKTPWGAAFDFSRPAVRAFIIQNAEMWITEFGVDGLRIDAVHQMIDSGSPHIVEELAARLGALDCPHPVHIIVEDDRNLPDLRENGITAAWNDDFHHAVHCLITGEADGYYLPYSLNPIDDLMLALQRGQIDEGQPRQGRDHPRGAPAGHLAVTAFVNSNQTHDQIGNRAQGERLISLIGSDTAQIAHALLLTSPYIPMLFMGEEIGARAPFLYFADFKGDLAQAVRDGRAAEFGAFAGFVTTVPDPLAHDTFKRSRPYEAPPADAQEWLALTRKLLTHRADHVAPLLKTRHLISTVEKAGESSLHAKWTFQAGTIETVLRFTHDTDNGQTGLRGSQITIGDASSPCFFTTKVTPS